MTYLWIIIAIVVVAAIGLTLYLVPRRGRGAAAPCHWADGEPARARPTKPSSVGIGPARVSGPSRRRPLTRLRPRPWRGLRYVPPAEPVPELEVPEPTAGRLQRLRARLARSQNVFGRGLLSVLSREHLDEEAWEEVEDALLSADVGVGATAEIVGRLRDRTKVLGTRSTGELRALLADELVAALQPDMDRTLTDAATRRASGRAAGRRGQWHRQDHDLRKARPGARRRRPHGAARRGRHVPRRCGRPAANLGVAGGRRDRARARRAATRRVLPSTPSSRAPTAPSTRSLIDTAGRLHTKVGLMDELGKVKRVVERQGPVDETLLVLDATTGQNGMIQARVFTEIVDVTGIVLTKLDGTAKGGIVICVQRELASR